MKLRATLSALIILAILTPIPAAAAQSRNLDRQRDISARIEAMRERITQRLADRQKLTQKRLIERRAELRDRQVTRSHDARFGRKLRQMAANTRLKIRHALRRVIRRPIRGNW